MTRYSKEKVREINYLLGGIYILLLFTVVVIAIIQHWLWGFHPLIKNNLLFQLFGLFLSITPALWFFTPNNKDFVEIMNVRSNYIQGDEGEDEVYQKLKKLGPEFHILNIVPGKYTGDIDFVVISHLGVTAIEVKNYTKRSTLNYNLEKDRKQARHGAGMINKLLKQNLYLDPFVSSLLVYAGNNRGYNSKQTKPPGEKTMAIGCELVNNALLGQKGKPLSQATIRSIVSSLKQYIKD